MNGMHVARATSRLSIMKPQMGAVVHKNGRVLGVGHNKPGSNKWTRFSRHAEAVAILNAGDCRGATLEVYREHRLTHQPLIAKPCKACQTLAEMSGIKKVVWSE